MAALALAVELELFRDLEAALVLHPEGEERNNTSEGGSDELARRPQCTWSEDQDGDQVDHVREAVGLRDVGGPVRNLDADDVLQDHPGYEDEQEDTGNRCRDGKELQRAADAGLAVWVNLVSHGFSF